jgi:hypothetical protein
MVTRGPAVVTSMEGGGSSRAVTRLHTMIRLTGYRARDLLRIRRALYRLTEKAYLTYVATYHICTNLRHYHGPPRTLPGPQPGSETNVAVSLPKLTASINLFCSDTA